jgi:hypothetical protein
MLGLVPLGVGTWWYGMGAYAAWTDGLDELEVCTTRAPSLGLGGHEGVAGGCQCHRASAPARFNAVAVRSVRLDAATARSQAVRVLRHCLVSIADWSDRPSLIISSPRRHGSRVGLIWWITGGLLRGIEWENELNSLQFPVIPSHQISPA